MSLDMIQRWLKHAQIVDATVAYDEPEMCKLFSLLIHQMVEMKGLDHHLLHLMQCYMKGVVTDEVPKFLAEIINPFHAILLINITLKITRITSYFNGRKLT